MILVLDRDGILARYSSVAHAASQLEAIDVENGEYEFSDEHGRKFTAEITAPVTTFRAGSFQLVPTGEPDRSHLESMLSRARFLDNASASASLDELRAELCREKS